MKKIAIKIKAKPRAPHTREEFDQIIAVLRRYVDLEDLDNEDGQIRLIVTKPGDKYEVLSQMRKFDKEWWLGKTTLTPKYSISFEYVEFRHADWIGKANDVTED